MYEDGSANYPLFMLSGMEQQPTPSAAGGATPAASVARVEKAPQKSREATRRRKQPRTEQEEEKKRAEAKAKARERKRKWRQNPENVKKEREAKKSRVAARRNLQGQAQQQKSAESAAAALSSSQRLSGKWGGGIGASSTFDPSHQDVRATHAVKVVPHTKDTRGTRPTANPRVEPVPSQRTESMTPFNHPGSSQSSQLYQLPTSHPSHSTHPVHTTHLSGHTTHPSPHATHPTAAHTTHPVATHTTHPAAAVHPPHPTAHTTHPPSAPHAGGLTPSLHLPYAVPPVFPESPLMVPSAPDYNRSAYPQFRSHAPAAVAAAAAAATAAAAAAVAAATKNEIQIPIPDYDSTSLCYDDSWTPFPGYPQKGPSSAGGAYFPSPFGEKSNGTSSPGFLLSVVEEEYEKHHFPGYSGYPPRLLP